MNERADAAFLRKTPAQHVETFKNRIGNGAMIIEGQEIAAVVRYIESLEMKIQQSNTSPTL